MSRARCVRLAVPLVGSLVLAGCARHVEAQSFEFAARVLSDPDEPLAGAVLRHGGVELGRSDEHGALRVGARGSEGERLAIDVSCPDGFRSPETPLRVTLHRSTSGATPQYEVSCPPLRRKLVVAVRAERGANLPVRYLGREVARTDASGAALLLLESYTDDTLELTLDTSQEPRLLPKSPSARFRVAERDDLVLFNQKFELAERAPVRRAAPRRPSGPVRIQ